MMNVFSKKENTLDYEKVWNTFCHPQKEKKYNTSKPEETVENKLARDSYTAAPNQK